MGNGVEPVAQLVDDRPGSRLADGKTLLRPAARISRAAAPWCWPTAWRTYGATSSTGRKGAGAPIATETPRWRWCGQEPEMNALRKGSSSIMLIG
ncbi:hypothetical protein BSL82_18385 (plasmid) [Tardibacter chloracetimidivorans]|uniref:Uncharacterized protein n=1 Tax=Tardibacter chloracetimidivorans TaxID=1921510 RepID=A0A1L4A0I7_9SPHN|nr:hypothetical protein BSL82_18385 [Tardibacter chloracetimidivorans]